MRHVVPSPKLLIYQHLLQRRAKNTGVMQFEPREPNRQHSLGVQSHSHSRYRLGLHGAVAVDVAANVNTK